MTRTVWNRRSSRASTSPRAIRSRADLTGVVAVFCAGAGDVGVAMALRAKSLGLPVNVMDDIAHSTFIFPAIVDRGDVVVAIGTGGTSPVVARRLREKIEAVLPGADRRSRQIHRPLPQIHSRPHSRDLAAPPLLGARDRRPDRRAGALRSQGRCRGCAEAESQTPPPMPAAKAASRIVGAGPGDPDLLTIKALRALQDADVVFYDELVSSEILDRIRRDASRVPVGRRAGKPGIGQDAINKLLIEAAKSRQARGAAEGRRRLRVRPRRRRGRSAAQGARRLFDRAGHHRRLRRRRASSRCR